MNSRATTMRTFNSTTFLRQEITTSNLLLTHHSKKLPGLLQLEVGRKQSQSGPMMPMTKTHLFSLTQRNKWLGGHAGLGDADGIDSKDTDLVGHAFNHFFGLKGCFFAELKIQPHPPGTLFLFPLNKVSCRGSKVETWVFSLVSKIIPCHILEVLTLFNILSALGQSRVCMCF